MKNILKPVLDGDYRTIGANPDLGVLSGRDRLTGELTHQCVDHHVFRSADGKWNLWGCIRSTAIGRLLYHWQGENITDSRWRQTGEILRVDRNYGESVKDWHGEEWIQSPFVIEENGKYFMFFGGHATGRDYEGNSIEKYGTDKSLLYINSVCQMCLMTSGDGLNWTRYKNSVGGSAVFEGPGEVRDPCLLKIGGVWHLYYAGSQKIDGKAVPGIYVRTSEDLINWSEYTLVHSDVQERFGGDYWNQESPHAVEKDGVYYLFITQDYASGRTHVFRSENPMDFGIGDSTEYYIGMIYAAAPEIITDSEGNEYITSNHNLLGGTMMCRLKWIAV